MTPAPRAGDCDPAGSATPGSTCHASSDHVSSTMAGQHALPEPIEPESAAENPCVPHATPRPRSGLTGRGHHPQDLVPLGALWPGLAARIRIDHPDLDENALVSHAEAARYRTQHIDELLRAGSGDAVETDRREAEGPAHHEILGRLKRVRYSLGAAQQIRGSR
jgi:hypothetical protein